MPNRGSRSHGGHADRWTAVDQVQRIDRVRAKVVQRAAAGGRIVAHVRGIQELLRQHGMRSADRANGVARDEIQNLRPLRMVAIAECFLDVPAGAIAGECTSVRRHAMPGTAASRTERACRLRALASTTRNAAGSARGYRRRPRPGRRAAVHSRHRRAEHSSSAGNRTRLALVTGGRRAVWRLALLAWRASRAERQSTRHQARPT